MVTGFEVLHPMAHTRPQPYRPSADCCGVYSCADDATASQAAATAAPRELFFVTSC